MKVLIVNGSPHPKGCTYTALMEAAGVLEKEGIETTLLQLGTKPIQDCIACGNMRENRLLRVQGRLCQRSHRSSQGFRWHHRRLPRVLRGAQRPSLLLP